MLITTLPRQILKQCGNSLTIYTFGIEICFCKLDADERAL